MDLHIEKEKGWMSIFARMTASFAAQRRIKVLRPLLPILHEDLVHTMRRFAIYLEDWGHDADQTTQLATDVCTHCRQIMGGVLGHDPKKFHCCLKTVLPKEFPADEDKIATWARSEPLDQRPIELQDDNAHPVSKNTVWCALMGRTDGVTNWIACPAFCSNDLAAAGNAFKCDREHWEEYYRSALVFPLRFLTDREGTEYQNVGFLAFDSPLPGAFPDAPDIFAFRNRLDEYRLALRKSAVFHLGALFADTLSMFMRNAYKHLRGADAA